MVCRKEAHLRAGSRGLMDDLEMVIFLFDEDPYRENCNSRRRGRGLDVLWRHAGVRNFLLWN